MPRHVHSRAHAVARVRSAPWRGRGALSALAALLFLWGAVRAELLALAPALALGLLVLAAAGLSAREPGAR